MRKTISLAGLIAILFLLTGCAEGKKTPERGYSNKYSQPDIIHIANDTYSCNYFYVVDKSTGVVYLQFDGYGMAGITVALNADGTPVTVEQLETDEVGE